MKNIVIKSLSVVLIAFALVACTSTPEDTNVMTPEDTISTFEFNISYTNAVPANVVASTGEGSAKATLNETKKTVSVEGTYKDLTSAATAAHIHIGEKGTAGGVVVALTTTANMDATSGTLSLESTTLTDEQIADMKAGKHYINIHTASNPSGEIRGQIE